MDHLHSSLEDNREAITNFGYLGLLPFFGCALGPWILAAEEDALISAFIVYSSIILAFLAGSLWAMALFTSIEFSRRHINVAMAISVWAFLSFLLPTFFNLLMLMLGFLGMLFWEKCFVNNHYPAWYQQLRHKLTWIAVACHMIALWNVIRVDEIITL